MANTEEDEGMCSMQHFSAITTIVAVSLVWLLNLCFVSLVQQLNAVCNRLSCSSFLLLGYTCSCLLVISF